jgi:RNA polymerase sigma-70 factor (ECF subfamily)
MIYMRLLNRDDTEDVVQETFVRAYSAWDSYNPGKAGVQTWLYAIARNTLINYMRKYKHFTQSVSLDESVELGVEDKELASLTDSNAQDAYLILRHLSDTERELLTMRFAMELSYREMAQQLGSNEKAVAKRMERLVSKCRQIAEQEKI